MFRAMTAFFRGSTASQSGAKHLLIRADGNPQIGLGHLMRCLALAQHWLERCGPVTFAVAEDVPVFAVRLRKEGGALRLLAVEPGSLADADATSALAAELGATWIVCDGYHFGAAYQARLRAGGRGLLFVDDYGHGEEYCADLVLNQNLYAEPGPYARRSAGTELLLGSSYALLRREFTAHPPPARSVATRASRLLVTLGGADPANFTSTALAALADVEDVETQVIVGGSNPNRASIDRAARALGGRATVVAAVDDMPARMAWADLAVSAGGSTCWELLYMGVPALVVVLADNQVRVAQAVARHGAGVDLGRSESVDAATLGAEIAKLARDATLRHAMAHAGQGLVDGRGAERVADAMLARL
jgi:UDP-2,4-diacetamido-2,4,6-trideoxy-beta-L-altropyranose hydrolase